VAIRCSGCGFPLSNDILEARNFRPCRFCGSEISVAVFPAMFAPPTAPTAAEMAAGVGDATCFYHSSKRAAAPCSQCGRFLCALCSIELSDETWCPECIEAGRSRKRVVNLENQRSLYDSMALALATWPALLVYPSLVAAPAAIFFSVFYWKRPSGITRKHPKIRFVLAITLALIQVALWIVLITFIVYKLRKAGLPVAH
jgi:hypothetical protein